MSKEFDGLEYTREKIAEKAVLMENHATDGSAIKAGCGCIQERHALEIMGYSSEGVAIATDKKEKDFYFWLGGLMRGVRKEVVTGDFNIPQSHNPRTRAFLPHGLTACEKAHPGVRAKLASCIRQAEIKCCGGPTTDYSACTCNPVAVCRAAVPCP